MTEYVVLRKDEDDRWVHVAGFIARSGRTAIREYLDVGSDTGTFVAVPARSWKPVTVKVETKTALKFS